MEDKEKIKEYKQFLEELVKDNSGQTITNGGIEYASVLMSTLLDNAKESAIMYCEFKDGPLTTDLCKKAFERFLSNENCSLKILLSTNKYIDGEPMRTLKELVNGGQAQAKVEVKLITDSGKQYFKELNCGVPCNFCVFDGKMYRLETDTTNFKALGSFNKPEVCDVLTRLFWNAYDKATEYSLD